MFVKHFIIAAFAAFVAAAIVAVWVASEEMSKEVRTVDFTVGAPGASGSSAPAGALEAARAYAEEHGLTSCAAPAHARLDDVVLTYPDDPLAGAVITPVGFDEALKSAEAGRWNVLACAPATADAAR